jgi:hypothetical protein
MAIHQRNWHDRPFDISNLLNPAFLGTVLRKSTDGFCRERERGLPFELAFVVFPLVLHGDTRNQLPNSVATRVQPWLYEHRQVLIEFAWRTREIVPFAKEAIMFAVNRDVVRIRVTGQLIAGDTKLRGLTSYQSKSQEIKEIIRKSEFVGRWLSSAGPSTNVYASFGITP